MQTISFRTIHYVLFIAIVAILLFIPFLGRVHLFDWDEINFAECSREMLVTGDYTRVYIDYKPFWEKPPLFFWLQSIAMKTFGITEFSARLPNAICGIVTLIVLFLCGKKVYNKKFGLYWSLAYAGSLFPNMYFKSGIIDPWFNLFIFISVYYFILYTWKRNRFDKVGLKQQPQTYAILSGVFMGLAMLTKGQVALIIFLLTLGVYLIYNRFKFYFSWGHALLFLLVAAMVSFTWYGYETIKNGTWFVSEFMKYQFRLFTTHDAGQKGFFGYHFVVILFGCFPASVFAIPSFFKTRYSSQHDKDFKRWMLILFWVVMILFSIVQSRIIHYSSLAWFPVTFLAAYTIYKWQAKELEFKKYASVIIAVIGFVVGLMLIGFPYVAKNLEKLIPYVKDKFAQANMQADVQWTGLESLIGVFFISTLITGLWRLKKSQYGKAAGLIFPGTGVTIFLASAIIVPKVERYSQGAAIDFFKERKGENCYVNTLGYKSYAQLFYTLKKQPGNINSYNQEWLLKGNIDKPAYFVTKVNKAGEYNGYSDLKELYRKNGFVFFKRDVPLK